eukprot:GHVH01002797.1.p1 GENE.GHVH01002797.1~~GHVH01002797.1.p1  ORF type:complete len:189 (+),score=29.37 GHVH01002797.1:46-612(+)
MEFSRSNNDESDDMILQDEDYVAKTMAAWTDPNNFVMLKQNIQAEVQLRLSEQNASAKDWKMLYSYLVFLVGEVLFGALFVYLFGMDQIHYLGFIFAVLQFFYFTHVVPQQQMTIIEESKMSPEERLMQDQKEQLQELAGNIVLANEDINKNLKTKRNEATIDSLRQREGVTRDEEDTEEDLESRKNR